MILKALELQGFKSFPDKTVLSFDRGMTAVVGPNGSGKSNISDAVRWVLGEQSTKNLRGSKMEDVIFSGTDERRAMGYAEVTLRLDNKDRSLNKDTEEVSVTRRYYRSGESEYRINGETVRLRDINELFMDTGLGRDGYSMVSQGKVADMVSSKSSQRRDMLEEAAGISHYRYRRADALRRLDQAEENLVRLRDILAELEGRVGPLKTQSEKAQQFLVLAEERKQLEISLWLYNIDHLKSTLQDQEHKIDLASAQYNDAEKSLTEIEQDIESAAEKARNITLTIEEIRRSMSESDERIADLNARIAVDKNTIEHNNDSIARVRRDMETAEEAREEVENTIKETLAETAKLQAQVEAKRKELESVRKSNDTLGETTEQYTGKRAELREQLSIAAGKTADARVRQSSAESSIAEIKDRTQNAAAAISERRELLKKLEDARTEAETVCTTAKETAASVQNEVSGYELRVRTRTEREEKRRNELNAVTREAEQAESRVKMLEDLEKNMEGYSGSVKAVSREMKRGTLRGIHGPLSQLITVENKYAAAVETALGAAVQFVVVDNENDAKSAISYLKKTNGGRATFLPISAIRGRDLKESGFDDCFGYIDIASNLVKTDKKYEEIIRAQLARTVVVEDMDSAIQIGRKYGHRFKLVTLDGQVLNAGGSMTGGSRVRNAGILSRSGEIERLHEELQKLQQKQAQAQDAFNAAEAEASEARAGLTAAKADLIRANEETVHADSALTLAMGQYDTVKEALDSLDREQLDAEARIAELTADAKAAAAEEAACIAENKRLEEELSKLSGSIEDVRRQQEEATQKAVSINLEIVALTKDMEASQDTVHRLRESTTSSSDRDALLRQEIEGYEASSKETQADIDSLTAQAEELRNAGTDSKEKIEALTAERNEAEALSSRLRVHERNKTDEREKISGELARLEERKANMLREYDETVNKLYDEYQLTRREAGEISVPAEDPAGTSRRLGEVKSKIKGLGSVNVGAIEEYKEVSERYEFLGGQISDVETSRKELTDLINELTGNMARQFSEQFNKINQAFGRTFTDLFGGGKAELSLEDEHDILESPINIRVQPPGKNVQNIDLLSGGEKGLSAIALLFAILKITPAPFCIFDEVEAALDDVNVQRFAQYCRSMTGNTQFILITHRRGSMEEADVMYGVTMEEEGVSKLLELKTAEMVKKLGIQ